jgi:TRAP-type C4-dicarboxylate transport system substrate-binding protein
MTVRAQAPRRVKMIANIGTAAILSLLPLASAAAEPITLKFSFFTSDRSTIYRCQVKPFVEAVNADGAGLVQIKVYFSGAISPVQSEQPQLILDGIADFADFPTGYVPNRFPDTTVLDLPGLFSDEREASLVFTRLVQAGALEGYKDFFVVGAFVSDPENIHSRKPIRSLADLKGKTVRVNNATQAKTLRKLGAVPVLLPINQTMDALSQGKVDGVAVPPAMLFEFGFGRLADHHYMIRLGAVPIVILMSRARLESLPQRAQQIIRQYSGVWLAEQSSACFAAKNSEIAARLRADKRRNVVEPSPSDQAAIKRVFASVVEEWAAQSSRHRKLLDLVKSEITKLPRPN